MDILALVVVSFFVFLLLGVPVTFSLLAASAGYVFFGASTGSNIIPIKLLRSTDAFVFLSVPLFVLAGRLMNQTGTTERLVNFSDVLVGRLKGGLAHVTIVVSMFFGGCTGTALSDVSAVGTVLIPSMVKKGFPRPFSAAVTAAASTMGPIIPPSIAYIMYGAISNVSIGDLFLAGIIPGVLVGVFQMVIVAFYARNSNWPRREKKVTVSEFLFSLKEVGWALVLPVLIIGGIVSGIATPTEAAAIAACYSLVIGLIIYRNLPFHALLSEFEESAIESGSVMVIVAAAALFGWVLSMEQVPVKVAEWIVGITSSPWQVLILINIALLVLGMFMDSAPAILLVTPILLPVFEKIGIDPIQAGILTCVNLITGLSTPPVGCCLFAAAVISGESFEKVSLATIPFLMSNLLVLLLISYVPMVSLFIPRVVFGH